MDGIVGAPRQRWKPAFFVAIGTRRLARANMSHETADNFTRVQPVFDSPQASLPSLSTNVLQA
jgi:hypothetical protein